MTTVAPRTSEGGQPGDIKVVPGRPEVRDHVTAEAARLATGLSRQRPPLRADLERLGQEVLERTGLPRPHLGFAMVAMSNEFWREQFAAVPLARRVLLLPHCLRASETCPGRYDSTGLECVGCRACALADMKDRAEALGYRVLIAEGTPAVVEIVLNGRADAVLGVACLDSLDEAYDRIAQLGVPNVAVPLLADGCVDTQADHDVIGDWMLLRSGGAGARTRSYVPLLRAARELFEPGELRRALGEMAGAGDGAHDVTTHAQDVALEWLLAGGKRFRPFVTLAGYAAPALGADALKPGADLSGAIPRPVRLLAVAIEAFHKASLVHDDVEDDDAFRYGLPTLHRRHGVPVAVNVGDYLVGLGYGCVAAAAELGADATADILRHLSDAHVKLCRGQGAELHSGGAGLPLTPRQVQEIYVLKTAPAFETAMYAGLRAASVDGSMPDLRAIRPFCRYLGVAYQVQNDLKDWDRVGHDKVVAGSDVLAGRPTMLKAFAHAAGVAEADGPQGMAAEQRVEALRCAYEEAGVFEKARAFIRACKERALAEAAGAEPPALGELMRFVAETVL